MNRPEHLLAMSLLAALLVSSCTNEELIRVEISSVEVVPATVNAVQGESLQLVATVHDDQNEELPSAVVEWSSEDPAIASVDENGVLVAHEPGTVRVHATYLDVSGSATVVVLRGPALAVTRDSVDIFSGVGGSPAAQTVEVTNAGTGSLGAVTASVEYPTGTPRQWLTAELSDTEVPATLTLRASTQGLSSGSYAATVLLATAGDARVTRVDVALHLTGFMVSETDGGTTVTEGGDTDAISVVLTARPSSNVVLDVRSSDATEVVTSRSFLVFTPASWNVSQTVTLQGVNDGEDDGTQTSMVIVAVNDGLSDDIFEGLPDQTVTVTTVDSDEPPPRTPGFTITPTGGSTRVTEAGGTDEIAVVLSAAPTSNVVLSLVSADVGEATVSPASLTFTPANWSTPQTAVVTGVDDALDDGDQAVTLTVSVNDAASEDGFDPLPDQTVLVVSLDDDDPPPPAGFTVTESTGSTRVTEAGGTDTLSVVLTSPPVSNVVLSATSPRPTEATVSPPTLTFTPASWNVAQSFVVTGVDDTADDGDQSTTLTIAVEDQASDDRFDPLADRTLTVVTVDDDATQPPAGFTVTETAGGTSVTEAGGTDTFSVVLTSLPLFNVVLSVTSADAAEATVSPATLTFSALTWATPQQVVVTGVDDTVDDGDATTTVTISVVDASSDDRFDPLADRTISVTTVDDDDPPPPPAGFTLTQSLGSTRVTETGGADSVTVVLTSPPTTNVVLDATSSAADEATVSPAALTFTPANWNAAQRFVVTGVDDALDDGDQTSTVTISVNDAASDDRFDPLADQTVTSTTVDDDDPPPPAGITVTETAGSTLVTEAGVTDTVTVVLASPPTSNVMLDLSSGNAAQATVSPAALTFTPANWNVAQRFVAGAVDDALDDGDVTVGLTIAVNDGGSDDRYDPVPDRVVNALTVDDDMPVAPAGVAVTESGGGTRVTEAGVADSIAVVLESVPASDVVLAVTSADTTEASVSPAALTFTPANWNAMQRIVVTAVNDTIDDGDRTVMVTVAVDDPASDDAYDALADETVSVSIVDDDPVPPVVGVLGASAETDAATGPSLALRADEQEEEEVGLSPRACAARLVPSCDVEHVRRTVGGFVRILVSA